MKHLTRGADPAAASPSSTRRISLGVIALGLAVCAGQFTAHAGIVSENELSGGGARWLISNNNGSSNGLPVGGECDDSPGFGVRDAELTDAEQSDALDHGVTVWVNDSVFTAPETLSVQPQSIAAGPVLMSGLNVSVEYYALPTAPLLRTLATFHNPSESPITATITLATNVGSDSGTHIAGSSSGDAAFSAVDRWVITDDEDENDGGGNVSPAQILAVEDGDPAITHVLFGPGAPSVTPASVSETVFDCAGPQGILATYSLTVPAGATSRLMFFNGLHETSSAAATAAEVFNTAPAPESALITGLNETQLSEIVNWQFEEGVELTSFLATGSGSFFIGNERHSFVVTARRDRRHRLRGSVSYTDFRSGLQFRSTRITGAQSLGARGVRLRGVGRINRSGPFTFTVDLVDNQGAHADTFGLAVSNGLTIPTTVIHSGNIRVRTPKVKQGGPLPVNPSR